jgi:hypothetical protein
MPFENTIHYALDTPLGIAEWNSLTPPDGGVLRLGPNKRTFTISMFHQLQCLNVVRESLALEHSRVGVPPPVAEEQPQDVRDCMDYLRHAVLCRAELRLENVKAWGHGTIHTTEAEVTHTCRDWGAVYDAAKENAASFAFVSSLDVDA